MNAALQYSLLQKPDIIEALEREGIKLKRRGKNYWFKHHGEKKASAIVSLERQQYHCFGCGEHGDIVDFIQKYHNVNFGDALSILGICKNRPVPIDPAREKRKLLQLNYESALTNLYNHLCEQSTILHRIRKQVRQNPGALTDAGIVNYAMRMSELEKIDNDLDVLLYGIFEAKVTLLKEKK